MDLKHESVLLDECLEGLDIKADGVYIDGTLGGGGHSLAICSKLGKEGVLIGIDQDAYALERAKQRLLGVTCKTVFVRDNFRNMAAIVEQHAPDKVDGILLDLGVSSFQLDDVDRGFSYHNTAKLDMRMDDRQRITAYHVVNEYDLASLEKVIRQYGEEKFAKRIASFIVEARSKEPIDTTTQLAEIIKSAIPAKFRRVGPHPARRTFQAIRIEVNQELEILEQTVEDAVKSLKTGGRLAIITFHSLEDRIIKNKYKSLQNPCTCPPDFPVCRCGKEATIKIITRKPIVAGQEELESNARARSAKLRIAKKI